MKALSVVVLTMSFLSSFAYAKSEMSVQQVVDRYNQFYPALQLSVAQPAKDAVLYEELELLGDSLNGEPSPAAGELVHLACCAVACGGSGCGKK